MKLAGIWEFCFQAKETGDAPLHKPEHLLTKQHPLSPRLS